MQRSHICKNAIKWVKCFRQSNNRPQISEHLVLATIVSQAKVFPHVFAKNDWIKAHNICTCICNYLCIWGQGDESITLIEVKEMRVSSYLRSSKWEYHPIWGQGNKSTILFEFKEMRVPSYSRSRKWEYHPIRGQGNKSTILFEVKEIRVPSYLRLRK